MTESFFEIVLTLFADFIPSIFKRIGAGFKWLIYCGAKDYNTTLEEDWNHRFGLLILILVSLITITFYIFRTLF